MNFVLDLRLADNCDLNTKITMSSLVISCLLTIIHIVIHVSIWLLVHVWCGADRCIIPNEQINGCLGIKIKCSQFTFSSLLYMSDA